VERNSRQEQDAAHDGRSRFPTKKKQANIQACTRGVTESSRENSLPNTTTSSQTRHHEHVEGERRHTEPVMTQFLRGTNFADRTGMSTISKVLMMLFVS
jgi:hypothetical protein